MNLKPTTKRAQTTQYYVVKVGPGFAVATRDEHGQERVLRNSYTSKRWVAEQEAQVWNQNQTTVKPQLA